MGDDEMVKLIPALWQHLLRKQQFNLNGIRSVNQSQSVAHPNNVGVNRDTRDIKTVAQYAVCGFSTHTG